MLRISLILILLLSHFYLRACSCDWGGNFIKAATSGELVIKGKVVKRTYHLENGKRYNDLREATEASIVNDPDNVNDLGESITVEIIEIIRGTEVRKTIEIFNTNGADCRESIRHFKLGKTYILSTYKSTGRGATLPNETSNDFAIHGCAEHWLEFIPDSNRVKGRIYGKSSRKKTITLPYEKLLKALAR